MEEQAGFSDFDFSSFTNGFGGIEDIFDIFRSEDLVEEDQEEKILMHQKHGRNMQIGITITFKEAYEGVKKKITYSRMEECDNCNGTGAEKGKTCSKCSGKGKIIHEHCHTCSRKWICKKTSRIRSRNTIRCWWSECYNFKR